MLKKLTVNDENIWLPVGYDQWDCTELQNHLLGKNYLEHVGAEVEPVCQFLDAGSRQVKPICSVSKASGDASDTFNERQMCDVVSTGNIQ